MSQDNAMRLLVGALMALVLLSAVAMQSAEGASVGPRATYEFTEINETHPNYWQQRKKWFYNVTRFDLTEDNQRLLGPKRLLMVENKLDEKHGHLPFWFDYKLFKKVFNKPPPRNAEEELERHNTYINTCMRVLKKRVLFRMLAGTSDTFIREDADKFHTEIFGEINSNGDSDGISFSVEFKKPYAKPSEHPIDRAIRLVKQEMEIVESRNQVETNLKAFDEVDGTAIRGPLPY